MGITTMLRSATISEGMEAALSVTTVTVFKEAASAEGRFLLAGQRAGGAGRVTRRGGARPRGPSGDTAGRGPLRGRTRPASGTRSSHLLSFHPTDERGHGPRIVAQPVAGADDDPQVGPAIGGVDQGTGV